MPGGKEPVEPTNEDQLLTIDPDEDNNAGISRVKHLDTPSVMAAKAHVSDSNTKGSLYEFTCLPNGLALAPRVFTKLMKPVYATLRSKGYLIVGYIDDILLLAKTPHELAKVVAETVALLRSLGFTIHESKCVTTPTQVAKFLGFLLDSKDMIISMIPEKAAIIKSKCHTLAQL